MHTKPHDVFHSAGRYRAAPNSGDEVVGSGLKMFLLPTDLENVSSVATPKIAQEEVFRGHSMYFFS